MTLWLASGSPRRRQLLEWAGWSVEVNPSCIDETRRSGDDPITHARRLAHDKLVATPAGRLALAADTVVHLGHRIFDKPIDRLEARAHLEALSGGWHHVTTGVCVRKNEELRQFTVTTDVRFRDLNGAEIDAYLQTGDADDKAGAYGIQGRAGVFVAEIRGSWTNVMGLPMEETLSALRELAGE